MLLGRQLQRPLVHVPRRPGPRVLVGERQEPADQPLPRHDRVVLHPVKIQPVSRDDLASSGTTLANRLLRQPRPNAPEARAGIALTSRPAVSSPSDAIPESSGNNRG